jgi:SPP1 gp7 family putative phage head morphogenesis protein
MFDEERSAQDLRRRAAAPIRSAAEKGVQSILAELRLAIDFETVGQGVQQFLQDKSFEIVDLVDGPVAERLRFTLQEGLTNGETVDQIADRVEETFKVERARAERIARTEIAESFNAGRFETMKEAGVQKIEWLTARDARVRDSHAELDGDVVVVGDRFANGLLYPLDPAGPPEEIVNCRCVALPAA